MNIVSMTIKLQVSIFIITIGINDLEFQFFIPNLDKFKKNKRISWDVGWLFEKTIILNAYKNLKNVFSQSNANFLFKYQDKDYTIELEPAKTLFFDLPYNFFEHQLKVL